MLSLRVYSFVRSLFACSLVRGAIFDRVSAAKPHQPLYRNGHRKDGISATI